MRASVLHAVCLLSAGLVYAIELDLNDKDSIISAGRTILSHTLSIYNQNSNEPGWIPGLLPMGYTANNYYWWHSAVMFDAMIEWWALADDDSLTDTISVGLAYQVGPDFDYLPPNQTRSLGNDDQSFWAAAAMSAAERGFPQPSNLNVTWLQLAQNVFESQVARWNNPESCGGGLKWQIISFNAGYNYKNAVSTLGFASLAARLARYTNNETYTDWSNEAIQWLFDVGFISSNGTRPAIYDGADDTTNCSSINRLEWTQNAGLALIAGAYAFNYTPTRSPESLLNTARVISRDTFAQSYGTADGPQPAAIQEVACTPNGKCSLDNRFMRASLARGLARARELTPDNNYTRGMDGPVTGTTYEDIDSILRRSAEGAAAQCSGGGSGNVCGMDWRASEYDGYEGVGEDVSALEILMANLPRKALGTMNTTAEGGTDESSASTGSGAPSNENEGDSGDSNAASAFTVPVISMSIALLGALANFL